MIYPHILHQPDKPILEVSNLSLSFNGQMALEDLEFMVPTGARVAVIGPNGAGKSTLFKVIAGVLPPTRGEVKISGFTPQKHICIAYVPQRNQMDWRFPASVADVVMMGRIGKVGLFRWPSKADWKIVHQALQVVDMEDLAEHRIGELSGGLQQRAFLARALAQESEIILMDEPLTGLDGPSQEKILSLLEILHERQITVMVATHDLHQASSYYDLIMLLNHRIIMFGKPEEVLTSKNLLSAYGNQTQFFYLEDGTTAITDTCCEGDDHNG
jgi:manganese/iron transport system ATP-binding protein